MFVTDINDVKIFNLSAGKSVPDWLADHKKKSKSKKKADLNRQIELIQDFEMPGVATSIRMSPDNQYILATGTYKPIVKCYEVSNLSLKFERCFDSEVTCFEVLSDDYSKVAFLQSDRYIEIHAGHGRHYRLRVPRFGRDMKYHKSTCDLLVVGTSSDIYRLNLERGQFLQPYQTSGSYLNTCAVNPEHNLILVGSQDGTVEAWDPRERKKCGILDVAMNLPNTNQIPSVTSINCKDGLHMGVGTASGHVLLYDIRSKEPFLIKDHLNKLPVKKIEFNSTLNNVYSLDSAMLKIWDESSGKQIAYLESSTNFNDFCTIPGSGMFFLAQEDVKMLTYYIPAMGPAPRWCSFLDNLTEEIESELAENIYDDYQFVTSNELEKLGLDHLIGTNLLRAYMHGYFIDNRLYQKAKLIIEPFEFEKYRKDKVRQEIESTRQSRLKIGLQSRLPKVNQDLAIKILEEQQMRKSKMPNLLEDSRFNAMFSNTDYKIDRNAHEYKIVAPALNRLDKSKAKELKKRIEISRVHELQEDEMKPDSDNDEDLFNNSEEENQSTDDDDEKEFSKEVKKAYKDIKKNNDDSEDENLQIPENSNEEQNNQPSLSKMGTKMIEVDDYFEFKINPSVQNRTSKISLEKRLKNESHQFNTNNSRIGNKQITFDTKKASKETKKREFEMKKHREERKQYLRSSSGLQLKKVNFK